MAQNPSEGKLIYHITHINNLPSILKVGLLSRKKLLRNPSLSFTDIADSEILSKREQYKEALSQYVLFHFFAKNPFDGAVCRKYGSENMVIITVRRDLCERRNYQIIPSHPLDTDTPDIYQVRWDILDDKEHRDYHEPEIRKACMAECIVKDCVPISDFAFIYVSNKNAADEILKMQNAYLIKDKIRVMSTMFPQGR